MNHKKIEDEINNYKKNRDMRKTRDTAGAEGFCNGAIHELTKILRREYD